jgi:hypothetical protein
MDPYEQENKAALDALNKDKEEAAKFTEGISGVDLKKEEKKPDEKPVDDKDKKPEETPADDPDKKPDDQKDLPPTPEPDKKPDDLSQNDKDKKPDETPPGHIPAAEWKDKKAKYEDALKAKDDEIARINSEFSTKVEDLQKQIDGKNTSTTKEEKIEAFAKKHGIDKEQVVDLLDIVKDGVISPDDKAKLDSATQHAAAEEEKTYFNNEFSNFSPDLKKQYPHATDEQLSKVKELLWEVGHKKEYFDKELDYVAFQKKDEIAKIIGPVPEGKKGIEDSHPGNGKNNVVIGKDFAGKTDFTALKTMPEEDVKRIIKEMDPETRISFYQWSGQQDNQIVEVNRKGRVIQLK